VKRHGAAVVVMAFDEQGQAASFDEKVCFAWTSAADAAGAGGRRFYLDNPVSLCGAVGDLLGEE
jgi:hypothetical protein